MLFITSNPGKLRETRKILGEELQSQSLDFDEPQSLDLNFVSEYKAKQAYNHFQTPVLVDDVSLVIHALGKLPGPFIKFFIEELGAQGIFELMSHHSNHSATATCVYTYYDGTMIQRFEGSVSGSIVTPRGNNGFGFDPIFEIASIRKTYAELSNDEKSTYSHRGIALRTLQQAFTVR